MKINKVKIVYKKTKVLSPSPLGLPGPSSLLSLPLLQGMLSGHHCCGGPTFTPPFAPPPGLKRPRPRIRRSSSHKNTPRDSPSFPPSLSPWITFSRNPALMGRDRPKFLPPALSHPTLYNTPVLPPPFALGFPPWTELAWAFPPLRLSPSHPCLRRTF